MEKSDCKKETLFISYCWSDGNSYADELENQLSDYFSVKRDKSQLIINDDIYGFMAQIANCTNVVIVLSDGYVKSLNCMLEVSYLVQQPDWADKVMVLVIDESIYGTERKLEILNYWDLRKKQLEKNSDDIGKKIVDEELEKLTEINDQLEVFLHGISRRKNPSQIAIVNELVRRKNNRCGVIENPIVLKGEQFIKEYLDSHGSITMSELSKKSGFTRAYTSRLIKTMLDKNMIEVVGTGKMRKYVSKRVQ